MRKRLSDIKEGQVVKIHSFCSDSIYIKLMEMGCLPGETVVVEQIAPFGDPISILVSGYNLSLRLDEAAEIWVDEILSSN